MNTKIIIVIVLFVAAAAYFIYRRKPNGQSPPVVGGEIVDQNLIEALKEVTANSAPATQPASSVVNTVKDAATIIGTSVAAVEVVSTALAGSGALASSVGTAAATTALSAGATPAAAAAIAQEATTVAASSLATGSTPAAAVTNAAAIVGPAIGIAIGVVAVAMMVDIAIDIINYEPDKWDYRIMEAQGIKLTPEQIEKMNQLIANGFTKYNAFTQVLNDIQKMSISGYRNPEDPTIQYHNIAPAGEPAVFVRESTIQQTLQEKLFNEESTGYENAGENNETIFA